jgi:hypothetical protein
MGLRDGHDNLPNEILTLMRSVSNQNDEANHQAQSGKPVK